MIEILLNPCSSRHYLDRNEGMEKSSLITTETESIKANVKVSATVSGSSKQWPFWPSFLVLFPILVGLTLTSSHLHYTLPKPQGALYKDGVAVFSEAQAMKYIYALSQHEGSGYPKYRIVGTEEMVEGEKYIMDVVEKIKAETALAGVHEVEIWHQVSKLKTPKNLKMRKRRSVRSANTYVSRSDLAIICSTSWAKWSGRSTIT